MFLPIFGSSSIGPVHLATHTYGIFRWPTNLTRSRKLSQSPSKSR